MLKYYYICHFNSVVVKILPAMTTKRAFDLARLSDPGNIKQRVMAIADAHRIGHREMAESIGMTYSNFTGKASGTPLNSNAVASIIEAFPEVNSRWLLTGIGDMMQVDDDAARSVRREELMMKELVLSQQRTIEALVTKPKRRKSVESEE